MKNARPRSGMTLLEMMVVIPLMVILLSTSAMLLTALFRSQQALATGLQGESARARLGVQLRTDAHAAAGAKCDSPERLEFALPGGETVHYEIKETQGQEAALRRELRKENAVIEREAFPLAGAQVAFSLEESGDLPLVRLRIQAEAEPRKHTPVLRSSIIEAAVGTLTPKNGKRGTP